MVSCHESKWTKSFAYFDCLIKQTWLSPGQQIFSIHQQTDWWQKKSHMIFQGLFGSMITNTFFTDQTTSLSKMVQKSCEIINATLMGMSWYGNTFPALHYKALMFSLLYAWTSCWPTGCVASDLTHHEAHIDGLVQERRNSSANALGLRLSCTNPSIWCYCNVSELVCRCTTWWSVMKGLSVNIIQSNRLQATDQSQRLSTARDY